MSDTEESVQHVEQKEPSELEEGERRIPVSSSSWEASVTTALSGLVTSQSAVSPDLSAPLWSLMMKEGKSDLLALDPGWAEAGEGGTTVSTTVWQEEDEEEEFCERAKTVCFNLTVGVTLAAAALSVVLHTSTSRVSSSGMTMSTAESALLERVE